MSIRSRKKNHLDICLDSDVQSEMTNGFENFRLIHEACPEKDFESFQIGSTFLDHNISAPILISSMTGGTETSQKINHHLAVAAETLGIPFALGSQRVFIDREELHLLAGIRQDAPSVPILANVGAVQLNYDFTRETLLRIVDSIEADGLILHFNPLQEVLQPQGNTRFSGLLSRIEKCIHDFPVPIIAKEVGNGFSVETARKIHATGINWIDVAGAGGTSWAKVESLANKQTLSAETTSVFNDWGIPTAECLVTIHEAIPELNLIASGGIRSGIEMRKACLLGADLCGVALPLLKPALESPQAVIQVLENYIFQYRVACFVSSGIERI